MIPLQSTNAPMNLNKGTFDEPRTTGTPLPATPISEMGRRRPGATFSDTVLLSRCAGPAALTEDERYANANRQAPDRGRGAD